MVADRQPGDIAAVATEAELRGNFGAVHPLATGKVMAQIDAYAAKFIGLSPFLCIGTADADGRADVSPRGDPPGFVLILDDRHLLIPDRPGNNRLDTMANIVANPQVGLLFFIPGIEDTVRVNGRARIVRDHELLSPATVGRKVPKAGILLEVEEVFFHCAKALKRSKLWDPAARVDRSALPPLAKIVLDQMNQCDTPAAEVAPIEADIQSDYKDGLY